MAMIKLGNSKMSWNRLQSTNSINSMRRPPRWGRSCGPVTFGHARQLDEAVLAAVGRTLAPRYAQ